MSSGAHGESLPHHLIRDGSLFTLDLDPKDGLGVSNRKQAISNELLNILLQIQESHGVCHGCTRLTHPLGNFVLFHVKLLGKFDIAVGFLDRV